jgi:hypothetical protein
MPGAREGITKRAPKTRSQGKKKKREHYRLVVKGER